MFKGLLEGSSFYHSLFQEIFIEYLLRESASLSMPANLENSTVATGLEKVNPHPTSQEG